MVQGSVYCHVHYPKAIWLQSAVTQRRLPASINWVRLASLTVVLAWSVSHTTIVVWGLAFANTALAATNSTIIDPHLAAFVVGDWAIVLGSMALFLTVLLVWPSFPLLPARRIIGIHVGLAVLSVCVVALGISWVLRLAAGDFSRLFLTLELTFLASGGVLGCVYLGAVRNQRARVRRHALTLILGWTILTLSARAIDVTCGCASEPSNQPSELFMAVTPLIAGMLLIARRGRSALIGYIDWLVADLADATTPLEGPELARLAASSRADALSRAVSALAALTPQERASVTRTMGDSSSFGPRRLVLAVLVVLASTFFLQAPAERAYAAVVCSTLHVGAPWCP
jgi:hypothetical protein